jgi:circadian clock protein KaiB
MNDSSRQISPPAARKGGRVAFRLYVAGALPYSGNARANLQALCAEFGDPAPLIEIVDVLREAERAMKDGIVVTPTLVRLSPKPVLTFLGSLSDLSQVRAVLGVGAPGPFGLG